MENTNSITDFIIDINKNSPISIEDAELYMSISNNYERDSFIVKQLAFVGMDKYRIFPIIKALNMKQLPTPKKDNLENGAYCNDLKISAVCSACGQTLPKEQYKHIITLNPEKVVSNSDKLNINKFPEEIQRINELIGKWFWFREKMPKRGDHIIFVCNKNIDYEIIYKSIADIPEGILPLFWKYKHNL